MEARSVYASSGGISRLLGKDNAAARCELRERFRQLAAV
jgi:hypothetical protein